MMPQKNLTECFKSLSVDEQNQVADFFSLHAIATRLFGNLSDEAKQLVNSYVEVASEDLSE